MRADVDDRVVKPGKYDYLFRHVCTVTEAAKMWDMDYSTIRRNIDEGRLHAIKSAGTWLVALPSLIDLLGEPCYGRYISDSVGCLDLRLTDVLPLE